MDEEDVVASLAALAHPARLRIFRLLVVAGKTGLTPGAITEACGVPSTALSFHLKEMAKAQLVHNVRSGRHLIYHAAFDRMNGLLGYLTANCCEGEECLVDTTAASCQC